MSSKFENKFPARYATTRDHKYKGGTAGSKAIAGDTLIALGVRTTERFGGGEFLVAINERTGREDTYSSGIRFVGTNDIDESYNDKVLRNEEPFTLKAICLGENRRKNAAPNEPAKSANYVLTVGPVIHGSEVIQKSLPLSQVENHGNGTVTVQGWLIIQAMENAAESGRLKVNVEAALKTARKLSDANQKAQAA